MKERLVMVGNGMAGVRVLEELLKIAPDKYDITVFGAEPFGNYNRILLSPLLSGEKTIDDIMLNDLRWYQDNHITLHAGKKTLLSISLPLSLANSLERILPFAMDNKAVLR